MILTTVVERTGHRVFFNDGKVTSVVVVSAGCRQQCIVKNECEMLSRTIGDVCEESDVSQ